MLEDAPDALWDTSQVFNHHLAKARRHLANDPPSVTEWTLDARIEQLALAESHLDDALHNITPASEEHRESELNLLVSLAITLDVHARLEDEAGRDDEAARLRDRSEQAFQQAQRVDADNSYVLENYARFKLLRARLLPPGRERTGLIVEAISYLELERDLDDIGRRDLPTLEELGRAYSMIEDDGGTAYLGKLAAMGSEAAHVALAKLFLRRAMVEDKNAEVAFDEAEETLLKVSAQNATWRTYLTLYQIVSRRRPNDFLRRLELLEALESDGDFAWPQQIRLEYAILLFQAGEARSRAHGAEVFKTLRDELPSRSSAVRVPKELRYLRDPATGFEKPLKTFVVVKTADESERYSWAIPAGWKNQAVVYRALRFPRDVIRRGAELDCLILFTNFGPQAVPLTDEEWDQ
jgi:hypothetical protein